MSNIEVFRNEQSGEVRAIEISGTGWLIGKDVTEKLGYKDTVNAKSIKGGKGAEC